MQTFTLNNGVEIPALGFGVFQIPQDQTKQAVLEALNVGYRHIDTAQSYMNEAEVGEALAATKIPRDKIFLTTKIWLSNYGYEATAKSVEASLTKLQTDYLDLVLLHQPYGDVFGSFKALADLQETGKIRAIGVSNFNSERLADIVAFQDTPVQVNQIEINPFYQREQDLMNAKARGHVLLEAWAPFAEGKNGVFNNETLSGIGQKYNKSVGQVILRWLVQRGIIPLAKTVRKERMLENIDIFDFELTDEDMQLISDMNKDTSSFFSHYDPATVEMICGLKR